MYRLEVTNRVSELNEASGRSTDEVERGPPEGHEGQGGHPGVQVGPYRRYVS